MNIITPKLGNISTKYKKRINTKRTLSPNYPPNQSYISFKGGPATLISAADKEIMNVFSQHYGNIGERLGQKVGKLVTSSEILKRSSRFSLEQGARSIREKKLPQALLENVLFPFVNLPLYAVSWVLKRAQSIPSLKDGARRLYNKPLLRIPRKLNELDSKTDMLKGIFDKTQDVVKKFAKDKGIDADDLLKILNNADDNSELKQEATAFIKESLYKVSNKFFDKHTGNFNTAYERPLNRIVTGLIPVAFLANDAYNLSVLCGDKKEDSNKEAHERARQEISRVLTTAYIQLLTFGAFTKQVNTIPWFTPLTSAATVLFSETSSRKRLGKPIFFLSKEKAKEYNKKETEKAAQENSTTTKKNKDSKTKQDKISGNLGKPAQIKDLSFNFNDNEPQVFTSFKSSIENKSNNQNKEENKKETKKALINFNTFKKGVIFLITAGFALSFIKNSSYTKNTKLVKGIKSIGEKISKKIYNPLAYKDFEISENDFTKLAQSLKDAGCKEIAEGHEFIRNKYGVQTAQGTIKMYKAALSSSRVPDVIKSAIDKIKSSGATLSEKEITQISDSIKTAVGLERTAIAEKKYSNVAKKAAEIIRNKKVNLSSEQMDDLTKSITESISTRAKEMPIQVETKLKPFVDIITQPFKFIMSAVRLPFKITSTLLKMIVSPIEKKAAQAALGKAELSKVEQGIHKAVTEIFGEKASKEGKISQVIFANAMEQLNKHTMPYRKADAALKQAIANGASQDKIRKLQEIANNAKHKLMVYVNTAVEKSFNGVTQSSNKNTELAMMTKLASSAVTSAFLVADNYNMVMIKSDGEDKEGAKEKANERIIQRLSALFYQTMLINWFNSTFRSTYNSSLKGMTAVAIPNTLTTELLTRTSIGMPVGKKSYEELQALDEKNEKRTGILGKYFKFMRLLTGKKPLKDRLPKDKTESTSKTTTQSEQKIKTEGTKQSNTSTNLLEKFSK